MELEIADKRACHAEYDVTVQMVVIRDENLGDEGFEARGAFARTCKCAARCGCRCWTPNISPTGPLVGTG